MLLMNTHTQSFLFFLFAEIPILSQIYINYIEGVCLYTWLKHRFWRNITNRSLSQAQQIRQKFRAQKKEEKKGMGIRKSYQFHHGGEMKEESEEKNTPKKGKEINTHTRKRGTKIHTVFHGIRTVTRRTFKTPLPPVQHLHWRIKSHASQLKQPQDFIYIL